MEFLLFCRYALQTQTVSSLPLGTQLRGHRQGSFVILPLHHLQNPPHPEHPPHPPQNSRAFEWKLLNLKHIHQQLPSTFVWRPVAGGSWKSRFVGGFQPPLVSRWPSTPGSILRALGLKTQDKAFPTGRRCSHGFGKSAATSVRRDRKSIQCLEKTRMSNMSNI